MSDCDEPPRRKGLFATIRDLYREDDVVVTTPPPMVFTPIVPPDLLSGPSLMYQARAFTTHAAEVSGWDYGVVWGGLCSVPVADHWMLFVPWGWDELGRRICLADDDYAAPAH